MAKLRPICVLISLLNAALYLYIFFALPKCLLGSSDDLQPEGLLSVRPRQSNTQSRLEVVVARELCPRPTVRVRLVGPEIYAFPPLGVDADADAASSSKYVHVFAVDLKKPNPLAGVYKVEVTLLQCHREKNDGTTISNEQLSCKVESEWNNVPIMGGQNAADNKRWTWMPSRNDYAFKEIDGSTHSALLNNLVTLKDGTALSKPKSLLSAADNPSSIVRYFSELSNYELPCWLGDDDAQRYHRAFMDLFPLLGSQRPFKFKYLRLIDVSDPRKDLEENTSERIETFDKCKIFFVSYSIDRIDSGISPEEYGKEVATLLDHIEKSHPDTTYPVWLLSQRSSAPTSEVSTQCLTDRLQRTPYSVHEFNEEARRALREHNSGKLPSEVHIHFMDNTDISETLWPSAITDPDKLDRQMMLMVAMRCIEKIAETVKFWRSNNQMGNVQGLMRNGTLIPNDEVYKHYTWT